MGWQLIVGPCFCCHRPFSFNPERVPSFSPTGRPQDREPICEPCITVVNQKRAAAGLPTWPIYPDSYEAQEVGG